MKLRDQLILTADAFCHETGMSRSRLSTILLSGGKRLDMIEAGGDIGTERFESVMRWLSENWPAGLHWPEGVGRPKTVAGFEPVAALMKGEAAE